MQILRLVPSRIMLRFRTYKRCTLLLCTLLCVLTLSTFQRALYTGLSADILVHPFEKLSEFTPVLKILSALNVDLILLDANYLKSLGFSSVNSSESETPLNNVNVISFGIFDHDSSKIQNFNQWHKLRPRWWLTETVGTDFRRMHIKEEYTVYTSLVTNYFFVSSTAIVHVAVIFRRNGFFWVGGVKNSLLPSRYSFLTNLTYGIPLPMGIDAFDCSHVPFLTRPTYNICIPADLDYYLWQVPYAQFFECHYEEIVYPFKRQYKMSEADTNPQREALKGITAISKSLRIPTMIIFGTLLGWYRQCDYIVESLDMDVGMIDYEWQEEMFRRVFFSKTFTLYRRLGTLDLGLEFRTHTNEWVWLDIFLMYPRAQNASYTYMLNQKYWMKSTYPLRKGICSAELLGVLVFIPCNYEDYIRAEYGTDGWFAPVGGHPHRNMVVEDYFDDREVVYLEHIYYNFSCANPNVNWGCDPEPLDLTNSTLYKNAILKENAT